MLVKTMQSCHFADRHAPTRSAQGQWKSVATDFRNSRFHDDVSDCLNRMGVPHENEYSAERGLFSLDIVLDPAKKVLVF